MQNLESVSFCPTKCTWNQDFSHSALDFYHCCKLLRVVVNHSYLLPCDLWLNGSAASAANCFVWCRLGAGTTRFCAGIVSVAKPLSIESKMADYSNSLYERLEVETGIKTGKRSLVSHNRRCNTLRANMFRHWNQRSFAVCVSVFQVLFGPVLFVWLKIRTGSCLWSVWHPGWSEWPSLFLSLFVVCCYLSSYTNGFGEKQNILPFVYLPLSFIHWHTLQRSWSNNAVTTRTYQPTAVSSKWELRRVHMTILLRASCWICTL